MYLTLQKMPTCLEKPTAMDKIFEILERNNEQKTRDHVAGQSSWSKHIRTENVYEVIEKK